MRYGRKRGSGSSARACGSGHEVKKEREREGEGDEERWGKGRTVTQSGCTQKDRQGPGQVVWSGRRGGGFG